MECSLKLDFSFADHQEVDLLIGKSERGYIAFHPCIEFETGNVT